MAKFNGIVIKNIDGLWQMGTIDDIRFSAKVYEEDSEFGINNGNVSKLWIEGVLNYDRGWEIKPKTPEGKEMLNRLLQHFKVQ